MSSKKISSVLLRIPEQTNSGGGGDGDGGGCVCVSYLFL